MRIRLVAGLPIFGAHPVARVREGRRVLLTLHEQVPAHVVAVQVSHHHHINLVGPHAISLEIGQQLAPGRLRRIDRLGAEARVDQNGPPI